MRGWVGVENEQEQKRLYAPSIQQFQGNGTLKPSAHLMGTGFQRFASCVMIFPFAQLHLENQIQQSFQTPALQFNKIPIRD